MLLASVLDGVNLLVWAQSEDARHGRNRPKRVTDLLLKNNEKDDFDVYETPEAFEAARRAILEKNMKEG